MWSKEIKEHSLAVARCANLNLSYPDPAIYQGWLFLPWRDLLRGGEHSCTPTPNCPTLTAHPPKGTVLSWTLPLWGCWGPLWQTTQQMRRFSAGRARSQSAAPPTPSCASALSLPGWTPACGAYVQGFFKGQEEGVPSIHPWGAPPPKGSLGEPCFGCQIWVQFQKKAKKNRQKKTTPPRGKLKKNPRLCPEAFPAAESLTPPRAGPFNRCTRPFVFLVCSPFEAKRDLWGLLPPILRPERKKWQNECQAQKQASISSPKNCPF